MKYPTTPARSAGRLPDVAPASRARRRRAGAAAARPARGRHAGRQPGHTVRRPRPEPADAVDVMGSGWFAAAAANVKPGMTVTVVRDGAVGLLGCSPPR